MPFRIVLTVCLAAMTFLMGCGEPDPGDLLAQANNTNLRRLANLYATFQSRHDWRGPADEAEFKAFLKGWNPSKLAKIGVDPNAIDKLFMNDRDGEPFKIRYGVPGHVLGSNAPVIFESKGVGGKRLVGSLNMTTQEVDAAEYQRLWSSGTPPT
jgi:hypothetical protein